MNAWTRVAAVGVAALLAAPAARAQAQQGGASPLATVTVESGTPGARIPRDFLGFSLEVSTLGQGIGAFAGDNPRAGEPAEQIVYALGHPGSPNTAYFRFMRNLGAGMLRLGGNSQDNSCWDRGHAPHPDGCQAELGPDDLRLFSQAARESGWRLIVGINLKQNSPAWALGEVADGIARVIPREQVFAIEPGNEPDLFIRTPYRAAGYSPENLVQDFLGYVRAFASSPAAGRYALVGPATCCGWRNPRDLATFVDGVGRHNLRWITVHNYSATTCNGRTVSIAQLLSPELMDRFNDEARPLAAVARERDLPIAMAETNSASCGGMPGVSNAFAAALWGVDYAFSIAEDGYVNLDFHFSYRPEGGSSYNPVDSYGRQGAAGRWTYRNVAQPLYYAMYLFAQHASGQRLLPARVESGMNVRAYAVSRCAGCAVKVFVLNKDTSAAGQVRVHLDRAMGSGSLLLLQAPTLGSLAPEVRYGGQQFTSGGVIAAPVTVVVRPDERGDYTFTLPNAAIALLTVERRGR